MRKIPQYLQIIIGLVLGVSFAIVSIRLDLPFSFTQYYIKPFGVIFLNALKVTALPLIFVSLVVGLSSIQNMSKLSRIGAKTFVLYTITTIIAVSLGLVIANLVRPGRFFPETTRNKLIELYVQNLNRGVADVQIKEFGPLQFLVNLVPENFFSSLSSNLNLLQIVCVAVIFAIALLKVEAGKRKSVVDLFSGLNDALIEVVKFVMKLAPIGVFSLVSSMLVEVVGKNNSSEIFDILYSLLWYSGATISGLAVMMFGVYPLIISLFTKVKVSKFFKGIFPAQIVAFSTSSSSATLPVLMENVEDNLGVSEEVSSFVLPLGTSVNMDGSALYLGVSIMFIAQALGMELSIVEQLSIVANVTISSLGVGGLPGASMVAMTMILHTLGIPAAGIALVLVPERILDMCRTVVNVTGDAAVAVVVASSENEITPAETN